MSRKVILVVSTGTSCYDGLKNSIGAIEQAIAAAFPDADVRRAFTSRRIIDKLKKCENRIIDDVTEALDRAAADGITHLVIQPTHLIDGYEYRSLLTVLEQYEDKFERIVTGQPLLTDDADFDTLIQIMTGAAALCDDGETAICFVGHGADYDENAVYIRLQEKLTAGGYENYYIGTLKSESAPETLIDRTNQYKKVLLMPLMVTAGVHAVRDIAGEAEGSWKNQLTAAGYDVECRMKGLGEIAAVRDHYVARVRACLEIINRVCYDN